MDGWSEQTRNTLDLVMKELKTLDYEVQYCVRGISGYSTNVELGEHIIALADKLKLVGEDIKTLKTTDNRRN